MKDNKWKLIINILIIIGIIYFVYILISDEIKANKNTINFCKEQCVYKPETKTWDIDMTSYFKENGATSSIPTKKSFSEKDLDVCIKYCDKDLGKEFKFSTQ
jgi:hypothetical protein